ncbi:MAG TPA: hypothetical protein VGE17_06160 [Methylophilus sp.]
MFTFKRWCWTYWQKLLGADRAYARYLQHFEHYRTEVVDSTLQQSLNLQPMSKAAFLQAWQKKGLAASGKSCGCKTGCCN